MRLEQGHKGEKGSPLKHWYCLRTLQTRTPGLPHRPPLRSQRAQVLQCGFQLQSSPSNPRGIRSAFLFPAYWAGIPVCSKFCSQNTIHAIVLKITPSDTSRSQQHIGLSTTALTSILYQWHRWVVHTHPFLFPVDICIGWLGEIHQGI